MHPSVSVIIPTYNSATYLPRAIESALAQTYTDLEVIVVDDGSTDETAAAIKPYLDRVRYIRQENRGVSSARNTGILASKSEFVAMLDADDTWVPEKLERQMHRFADPEIDIVYSDVRVEFRDGSSTIPSYLAERPLACEGVITHAYIKSRFLLPSAMVLRRSAMEDCGLFDETLHACEDLALFGRMSLRGNAARVDEALTIRYEGTGQNLTGNGEKVQDHIILALHRILCDELITDKTRKVLKEELGLNYFYRGYSRAQKSQPGARLDLLRAIRFGSEVRSKALRSLLATTLPRIRHRG